MEVLATELVTGLAKTAVPSLVQLLKNEWGLDKTVKEGLKSLSAELRIMQAFLENVSRMPPKKLDPLVNVSASEVRELFAAIEAQLHHFMMLFESTKGSIISAYRKPNINRQVDKYIKETLVKVKELRERHGPYPSRSSLETSSIVNLRFLAMHVGEPNPEGIEGPTIEVTNMLSKSDYVSIVGMMGLGKTTLARAVYDHMKEGFECTAFVLIGKNANMQLVLKNILYELGIEIYGNAPQEEELIEQLQSSVADKRCLLVIDDIWDNGTWNLVEEVFKNSAGSKIITTTRNRKVAKEVGGVYPMKPLSHQFSKKLLKSKAESDTHDIDFDVVSDRILCKCGGVPMAINTIGRFLAKNKSRGWYRVYDSIGFDEHKKDGAFEHIKQVLSCSYFDLPYHIQKCFLYLSLFPEDHWIEKNMLIWRWVAEGLVAEGNEHNLELFELGETYFNELTDRSMVQWAVSPRDLGQGGCRVHSLMFELMHDLSNDHNFSTVLGMKQESTSQTSTIHRLAIHKTSVDEIQNTSPPQKNKNQNTRLEVGEVLSFYASMCPGSSLPPLSRFERMRVIDLDGCNLSIGDCKLKHLGKLAQLCYVGLFGTHVAKLPKEIGGLSILQTLDVTATGISELPSFVGELCNLRCLRAGKGTRMVGRVGKLISLEELWLHSADKSPNFAVELRKLTKLRVLVIHFDNMEDFKGQEALVESLRELKKLQVLQVWFDTEEKVCLPVWEGRMTFLKLRQLLLFGIILPSRMSWIQDSCVPELTKLLLEVEVLKAQDLQILGKMMSLRALYLHSKDNQLSYTADKGEFKLLEYLNTNIELVCGDGALPRIQELEVGGVRVGVDVGLQGNMPLLERAIYHLDCKDCGPVEVRKAETTLRQASQAHPNRPVLSIKRWNNVELEAHLLIVESILPELAKALTAASNTGDTASNLLGSTAGLVDLFSDSIARFLTTVGRPPTLAVDDAIDKRRAPSQGPNHNTKGERPFSTESLLAYLNSQIGADAISDLATQVGKDPATLMNLSKKFVQNPEFIDSMNNILQNMNGSLSGADISRMGHLMVPDIISFFEQNVDVPGRGAKTLPRTTSMLKKMQEQSSSGSFKFDASNMLAFFDSLLADNAVPATDPAGYRNIVEKCVQNPETVACLNNMVQNASVGSLCGSDFSRLGKLMMQDVLSSLPQETDKPGMSQGEANLEGNDGAGPDHKPPPKVDANTMLCWLNSPDGATFSSGEATRFGMGHVAYVRILEKCLRDPKMIASMSTMAWNGDFSSMTRYFKYNIVMAKLIMPDILDYFIEQYSPSTTPQYADGGGPANTAGSSVAQDMGVAATRESNQDGENFARMLKELLPAVEQQGLAANTRSGQPSSAQSDNVGIKKGGYE